MNNAYIIINCFNSMFIRYKSYCHARSDACTICMYHNLHACINANKEGFTLTNTHTFARAHTHTHTLIYYEQIHLLNYYLFNQS